jgi:hypothetical protein
MIKLEKLNGELMQMSFSGKKYHYTNSLLYKISYKYIYFLHQVITFYTQNYTVTTKMPTRSDYWLFPEVCNTNIVLAARHSVTVQTSCSNKMKWKPCLNEPFGCKFYNCLTLSVIFCYYIYKRLLFFLGLFRTRYQTCFEQFIMHDDCFTDVKKGKWKIIYSNMTCCFGFVNKRV